MGRAAAFPAAQGLAWPELAPRDARAPHAKACRNMAWRAHKDDTPQPFASSGASQRRCPAPAWRLAAADNHSARKWFRHHLPWWAACSHCIITMIIGKMRQLSSGPLPRRPHVQTWCHVTLAVRAPCFCYPHLSLPPRLPHPSHQWRLRVVLPSAPKMQRGATANCDDVTVHLPRGLALSCRFEVG